MVIRLFTLIFILSFSILINAQSIDLTGTIPVCSDEQLDLGPSLPTSYNNIRATCFDDPLSNKITFFYVKILEAGTFTFLIKPDGKEDYDFVSWKNPNLNNLGPGDRGTRNYNPFNASNFNYNIGLSLTSTTLCNDAVTGSNSGIHKYYDVIPGDVILIAVDRYEGNEGFSIDFGGTSTPDCTILGDQFFSCVPAGEAATFNLSNIKQQILLDYESGFSAKIFNTEQDAASNTNEITTTNYILNSPINQKELFVRINNQSNVFVENVKIFLNRNEIPKLTEPSSLEACTKFNESFAVFDLDSKIPEIIANPTSYNIYFYEDLSNANLGGLNGRITSSSAYSSESKTIYVRVENKKTTSSVSEESCFDVVKLELKIVELPILIDEYSTIFCSNELTDLSTFLTNYVSNTSLYTFRYFKSIDESNNGIDEIMDYANYSVLEDQTIFILIENSSGCSRMVRLNLEVKAMDFFKKLHEVETCAESIFDLNIFLDLFYNDSSYSSKFYPTYIDAQNQTNEIRDVATYNVGQDLENHIYIRVSKGTCYEILDLIFYINKLEFIKEPVDFFVCPDYNGNIETELEQLKDLYETTITATISFYSSLADANAKINTIDRFNGTGTIWVRFDYLTCFTVKSLAIVTHALTYIDPTLDSAKIYCLDKAIEKTIDLTEIQSYISSDLSLGYQYFLSESDAQNQINELTNPSNFEFSLDQAKIWIRISKDGFCSEIISFDYKVSDLPRVGIQDVSICLGQSFTYDFSDTDYTFEWKNNSSVSITQVYEITEVGDYTVTVISKDGCVNTYNFVVTAPMAPIVKSISIDDGNLTILLSGSYSGVEYSIDGGLTWQSNNKFSIINNSTNYYPIMLRYQNCEFFIREIVLPTFSTFISPNGDGINDVWQISPADFNQEISVLVYDRYGHKVFETKSSNNILWDGKINGTVLTTDSYWYQIEIPGDELVQKVTYSGSILIKNK